MGSRCFHTKQCARSDAFKYLFEKSALTGEEKDVIMVVRIGYLLDKQGKSYEEWGKVPTVQTQLFLWGNVGWLRRGGVSEQALVRYRMSAAFKGDVLLFSCGFPLPTYKMNGPYSGFFSHLHINIPVVADVRQASRGNIQFPAHIFKKPAASLVETAVTGDEVSVHGKGQGMRLQDFCCFPCRHIEIRNNVQLPVSAIFQELKQIGIRVGDPDLLLDFGPNKGINQVGCQGLGQ
jgi:hypothetical protein